MYNKTMDKDYYNSKEYFEKLNKYFMAANYLSVAQLYLKQNPLLRDHELKMDDVKKKLVGHWGTVPGQNFIYAHCNRVIQKYGQDMILLSGPGHGGNFLTANCYLEGTYSQYYPEISFSHDGMSKFCKQFSFPGGIGSHCVPETPGSIHEGGELGYVLAHAYGSVLDNSNLIAVAIVGDGEAETGPLATSWHANKFLNKNDGAVLPILHLNGYKINNPTILSRISKNELKSLMQGYGYNPYFVEGDDPMKMHKAMAEAMDKCIEDIHLRKTSSEANIRPPMIILRTPKGWTGPKEVDGKKVEGSFRAHQIPLNMTKPEHLDMLKNWLLSYKPNELFDEKYQPVDEIKAVIPKGNKRMCASPYANGGKLLKELIVPPFENYAIKFRGHGRVKSQDMMELGSFVRDIFKLNKKNKNYRIFSPDEAMSNRLNRVFESENRTFNAKILDSDESLASDGRVMDSYLSEHLCEGMLEGYLLTGRHGMFDSYEAFIRVVDSMVSQHAKWLKACNEIPWREDISSLNLVLTSNVWQQDHNGFTHQDPGMLDHLVNKKADVVRIYLPPDTNTLLSCYDHCARSKNYVNIIVASKHPSFQWLNINEAKRHCKQGASEWKWAGKNDTSNPDIIITSCGDTVTLEALATVKLLNEYLPSLNIKFVNVVDLMKLDSSHPHGLTAAQYEKLFPQNVPVIFNFHGYPQLIHTLSYNRPNHQNLHVSGYREEGTITTAFDMRVRNCVDRYHLVLSAIKYLSIPEDKRKLIQKDMQKLLNKHEKYIREFGIDMPEILDWNWNKQKEKK